MARAWSGPTRQVRWFALDLQLRCNLGNLGWRALIDRCRFKRPIGVLSVRCLQ